MLIKIPSFAIIAMVLIHAQLFATPWTVTHQASLSMEFSGQEYWSGLPFPTPGDLPTRGIESTVCYVSCIGKWIFTTQLPGNSFFNLKNVLTFDSYQHLLSSLMHFYFSFKICITGTR